MHFETNKKTDFVQPIVLEFALPTKSVQYFAIKFLIFGEFCSRVSKSFYSKQPPRWPRWVRDSCVCVCVCVCVCGIFESNHIDIECFLLALKIWKLAGKHEYVFLFNLSINLQTKLPFIFFLRLGAHLGGPLGLFNSNELPDSQGFGRGEKPANRSGRCKQKDAEEKPSRYPGILWNNIYIYIRIYIS